MAIEGLIISYEYICANEEEITKMLLNAVDYKFKSVKEMKSSFNELILMSLKRAQGLSSNKFFHFYAVKYFLINGKCLLALKSLLLLKRKYPQSFEYRFLLIMFSEFIKKNEKECLIFIEIMYELVPELKQEEIIKIDDLFSMWSYESKIEKLTTYFISASVIDKNQIEEFVMDLVYLECDEIKKISRYVDF